MQSNVCLVSDCQFLLHIRNLDDVIVNFLLLLMRMIMWRGLLMVSLGALGLCTLHLARGSSTSSRGFMQLTLIYAFVVGILNFFLKWSAMSTHYISHKPMIKLEELNGLTNPLIVGCEMAILKIYSMIVVLCPTYFLS